MIIRNARFAGNTLGVLKLRALFVWYRASGLYPQARYVQHDDQDGIIFHQCLFTGPRGRLFGWARR